MALSGAETKVAPLPDPCHSLLNTKKTIEIATASGVYGSGSVSKR
jgi:hypothetical protein